MAMPSGRRSSEPVPMPSASGRAPSSAASVVIMIGPEAQQARLEMASRGSGPRALGLEREVDHHDRVLLHDADEQDDADQRDDLRLRPEEQQRQQGADAGRGQRREDRERVDVALVEHAEHDVDRDQRGQDQQRLVGRATAWKACAVPWKLPCMLAGRPISRLGALDRGDRVAERRRRARRLNESVTRRELALVVDRERRGRRTRSAVNERVSGTVRAGRPRAHVDVAGAPSGDVCAELAAARPPSRRGTG